MPIYMKFGDVKGDVTEATHKDWIRIDSCQYGIGRGISAPVGTGQAREASLPSISEVTVTKLLDVATPLLLQKSLSDSTGVDVELSWITTGSDQTTKEYQNLKLTKCLISGYSQSSGGDKPMESWSLNFIKIEWGYSEYTETTEAGDQMRTSYDLAAAKSF